MHVRESSSFVPSFELSVAKGAYSVNLTLQSV